MAISNTTGAGQGAGGLEAFQRLRAQAQQKIAGEAGAAKKNPAPATEKTLDVFAAAKARTLQAAGLRSTASANGAMASESGGIAPPKTYQKNGAINAGENRPRLGQYVDFVA